MMVLPKFLKFHVHEAWPISFLKISISCQHGLLCWMVRIPKYFGTCLCTSSQRNSPSLCCKVVVYSVNYSFCLKQISLNQFWNRISIISISYSCTSMWLQKEFTLLHGQFLTVRCEHYQICVKKSWSEFNQILCRHSIAPKLAKCLQFEVCQICGLVLQCAPKLIFFNDFFLERFGWFLT